MTVGHGAGDFPGDDQEGNDERHGGQTARCRGVDAGIQIRILAGNGETDIAADDAPQDCGDKQRDDADQIANGFSHVAPRQIGAAYVPDPDMNSLNKAGP